MLIEKLDKYLDVIEKTKEKEDISDFPTFLENFCAANEREKIIMMLNLNEEDKEKLQKLIDGGLI